MRTNVSFRHPADFVPSTDQDGILSVEGAGWFVSLLRRVPGLQIDESLCQEDWGVVVFVRRNRKQFWIGLSIWPDSEQSWLAHFHHGSFALLQPFTSAGKSELAKLVSDFHDVLTREPAISNINWYLEREMTTPNPTGFATPMDDECTR